MALPRYDALRLDEVLIQAGFVDLENRKTAWAVAMRESAGTPGITGGPNPNGSYDYGLFQINDIHRAGLGAEWNQILDGLTNARIAARWTGAGKNWSAWGLGTTGWAGTLREKNPEEWQRLQDVVDRYRRSYDGAIAAAKESRLRPIVRLSNLKPGLKNPDIGTYQKALRAFVGAAAAASLNPSGPTTLYGKETRALTTRAYEIQSRRTGSVAWLRGDLTTPGTGLLSAIGLRWAA